MVSNTDKLFVLDSPNPTADDPADTEYVEEENFNSSGWERCPVCNQATSLKKWDPPYSAHLECYGRELGDIAYSAGEEMLISGRFARLLEIHPFAGIEVLGPCTITGVKWLRRGIKKRKVSTPIYFVIRPRKGRTAIDEVESGIQRDGRPVCPECREGGTIRGIARLVMEPETRDDLHFFYPRGFSGVVVCTAAFRDSCVQNRITNVRFIPAEEFSWIPMRKPAN